MSSSRLLGVSVLCLLASSLLAPSLALAFKRTAPGGVAADFRLPGVSDGALLTLSEQRGERATVILFWAAWSPRSMEALRDVQGWYAQHRSLGLQVVGVNVENQEGDPQQRDALRQLVAANGWSFPVVVDADLAVFDRYGVVAVPSLVLTDRAGTVLELLDGYAHTTREVFRERVLEVLGLLPTAVERAVGAADAIPPAGVAGRYFQMGELFLRKKQVGRALAAYRRAVAEDPEYAAAYLGLARALDLAGDAAAAAEARQRAALLKTTDTAATMPTAPVRAP